LDWLKESAVVPHSEQVEPRLVFCLPAYQFYTTALSIVRWHYLEDLQVFMISYSDLLNFAIVIST